MTNFLFDRDVTVKIINREVPSDIITIENPRIKGKEPIYIDFQVEKQVSTEPNKADINIYNLSDDTAAKINFRRPILSFNFGKKIELYAGYLGRSKKIFSGVITSAITSRNGNTKITRIECRNIFYELMQLPINETFAAGQSKEKAVLKILNSIGATVDAQAKTTLRQRLAGQVFKEKVTYSKKTAYNVIEEINKNFFSFINIYFDDIGVSFNPIGLPLDQAPIFYSQENGLLGTPKPHEKGTEFTVLLDNDLKMSAPVTIASDTIRAFFQTGNFVVRRIIHAGTNRSDGVFESRADSVFDRTNELDSRILLPASSEVVV